MLEAVFISDLHLHPDNEAITKRFEVFISWAGMHTKALYILGDLFHVWAGDDVSAAWALPVAHLLQQLAAKGVRIYYMHGNRDFLLGPAFAACCHMEQLPDPFVIALGEERVLLSHGDAYCTRDLAHQWLRRLTRNRRFRWIFLNIPSAWRCRLVERVRARSQQKRYRDITDLDAVPAAMVPALQRTKCHRLIHGHTHQPGIWHEHVAGYAFQRYVLSDWDDIPSVLCYDRAKGFYLSHI